MSLDPLEQLIDLKGHQQQVQPATHRTQRSQTVSPHYGHKNNQSQRPSPIQNYQSPVSMRQSPHSSNATNSFFTAHAQYNQPSQQPNGHHAMNGGGMGSPLQFGSLSRDNLHSHGDVCLPHMYSLHPSPQQPPTAPFMLRNKSNDSQSTSRSHAPHNNAHHAQYASTSTALWDPSILNQSRGRAATYTPNPTQHHYKAAQTHYAEDPFVEFGAYVPALQSPHAHAHHQPQPPHHQATHSHSASMFAYPQQHQTYGGGGGTFSPIQHPQHHHQHQHSQQQQQQQHAHQHRPHHHHHQSQSSTHAPPGHGHHYANSLSFADFQQQKQQQKQQLQQQQLQQQQQQLQIFANGKTREFRVHSTPISTPHTPGTPQQPLPFINEDSNGSSNQHLPTRSPHQQQQPQPQQHMHAQHGQQNSSLSFHHIAQRSGSSQAPSTSSDNTDPFADWMRSGAVKRSSDKSNRSALSNNNSNERMKLRDVKSASPRPHNHHKKHRKEKRTKLDDGDDDKKARKKKGVQRHAIYHRKKGTDKLLLRAHKSSHHKYISNGHRITAKKDSTTKFLRNRIKQELLFQNLPDDVVKRMVKQMYRIDISPGDCIVAAGDPADAYFIIEKGALEVLKSKTDNNDDNSNNNRGDRQEQKSNVSDSDDENASGIAHSPKYRTLLQEGDTFGESALLYASTHKHTYCGASTSASCRCWALDQETFDEIRKSQASSRLESNNKLIRFLHGITMFHDMSAEDLQPMCDAMLRMTFRKHEKIVCQGDSATHFFIIYRGACVATKRKPMLLQQSASMNGPTSETISASAASSSATPDASASSKHFFGFGKNKTMKEIELKSYTAGDCFGELGIMKSQQRAATVRVTSDTLVAYALPAPDFKALLDYDVVARSLSKAIDEYAPIPKKSKNRVECTLGELKEIGCLGVGAFGRVTLVERATAADNGDDADGADKQDPDQDPEKKKVYALKRVRKNRVVETSQQEHIINEKRIMWALDSPFCIKLYATFKDELNVYFLLEPVMGGELFSLLRHERRLRLRHAMFYCANVVLAFEYLHSKLNVIYRDLKPENMLIAQNGYCKLVDFGFAKKRDNKSSTLCGTPQYLAPEVIQNMPHGFAVDWWSVGILVYEMIFGYPPFEGDENMKMYEKILTAPVEFPTTPKTKPYAKDIINSFLRKQAHKRLGAGTKGASMVKKHEFFKYIEWNKMYHQQLEPPWKPRVKNTHDLSAFDRFPDTSPDGEELISDPTGTLFTWCEEF